MPVAERRSLLTDMRPLIASVLAALASACSAPLDTTGPHVPVTVTRLSAELLSFTYFSQLRQPEQLVIRDQAAWVNAWASLWPLGAPIAAPPNVDFNHEMIVLVALGERPTGGYSILVDSAASNADGLIGVGRNLVAWVALRHHASVHSAGGHRAPPSHRRTRAIRECVPSRRPSVTCDASSSPITAFRWGASARSA